jgi:hypothetical protein
MIKFFRKIRYDLLGKNKTGKYFKYAVGEIVLVVIGILIALSINNWNEIRKNRHLESQYVKRLLEDLKEDEAILQAVLNYQQEVKFQAKKAIQIFENTDQNNVDPVENLINLYQASQIQESNQATSTYKELIASGQINLIADDALKTAIIRYYELNWTETHWFTATNTYRINIRSKMPDYIQSEIRSNCGDIYVKIRESIEITLPKTCDIDISPEVAQPIVNLLKADEGLKNDLRFLSGNLEGELQDLFQVKEQLEELIQLFDTFLK